MQTMSNRPSDLSLDELQWISFGERSHSADTLFSYLSGIDLLAGRPPLAPHDMSTLGTCIKLLESCPRLNARFSEIGLMHPKWAELQTNWEAIRESLQSEAPMWRERMGRAPETYALLSEILRAAS